MLIKKLGLTSLLQTVACAALALGFVAQIHAADANGKWTWSTPGRNGGDPRVTTLTLKVDGEKVTGNVSSPGRQGGAARETEISDGKLKGEDLSFSVVREVNGNKMTTKYSGKVSATSIKGKIEFERNGETQSRDWEAKRPEEKK